MVMGTSLLMMLLVSVSKAEWVPSTHLAKDMTVQCQATCGLHGQMALTQHHAETGRAVTADQKQKTEAQVCAQEAELLCLDVSSCFSLQAYRQLPGQALSTNHGQYSGRGIWFCDPSCCLAVRTHKVQMDFWHYLILLSTYSVAFIDI